MKKKANPIYKAPKKPKPAPKAKTYTEAEVIAMISAAIKKCPYDSAPLYKNGWQHAIDAMSESL